MLTVSVVESQVKLQVTSDLLSSSFLWPSSARQNDDDDRCEKVHCTSFGSVDHVGPFWGLDTCTVRMYSLVEVEDHLNDHWGDDDDDDAGWDGRKDCSSKRRKKSECEKKQCLLSSSFWQMSLSRL